MLETVIAIAIIVGIIWLIGFAKINRDDDNDIWPGGPRPL